MALLCEVFLIHSLKHDLFIPWPCLSLFHSYTAHYFPLGSKCSCDRGGPSGCMGVSWWQALYAFVPVPSIRSEIKNRVQAQLTFELTIEPVLLTPGSLTPEAHEPWSLRPTTRGATAVRIPSTTTRERPPFAKTRKSPHSSDDSAQPKINKIIF